MHPGERLTRTVIDRYRLIIGVTVLLTLLIAAAAGLPALLGRPIGWLHTIEVDTDPENMLSADEPVRVFHDHMKETLGLYDMVVVGIVNEQDPDGVFNPESLAKIHALTEFAERLDGDAPFGQRYGLRPGQRVIAPDIIAPSTVDNMVPGENTLTFEWLMPQPPASQPAATEVLVNARRIPFFRGSMVPADPNDNTAVCLYLPISSKDISYKVYRALNEKIAELGGPEHYHITGLPVAEDTFGVEMFIQMAISAPAAMLVIFLLMLAFFRKLVLIVSPMIVALVSVICTMGALVIAGFPIHIMSSMIPIFIMPIAVLDSIHIISEFFEKYQATRDRRQTLLAVMDELFMPMLYTSLTSAAGFASLALTPIPPVQVFGVFVAAGVMVAWLLTITFIPAFVMVIPEGRLANFGARHVAGQPQQYTGLSRFLRALGGATYRRAKPIVALAVVVLIVAGVGISRININDNPIKWFEPGHPIRVADRELNEHFAGTYMAYLALQYDEPDFDAADYTQALTRRAAARADAIRAFVDSRLPPAASAAAAGADSIDAFFEATKQRLRPDADEANDEQMSVWNAVEGFLDREWDRLTFADPPVAFDKAKTPAALIEAAGDFSANAQAMFAKIEGVGKAVQGRAPATRQAYLEDLRESFAAAKDVSDAPSPPRGRDAAAAAVEFFIGEQGQLDEVFKRPGVLAYMKRLGEAMAATGIVGKSNSLVEIVETVHRDLHNGEPAYQRIPPTRKAVGSCITQFQSSHRPQDLGHFVTTHDFQTASMWVQLNSGDNKDMEKVVQAVDAFVADNPPPAALSHRWFGLTYINVVWQDKMVSGMLEAFAGSFLVVFLLMTVLFRSALWGLLSMIPLTVTIAAIYGAIGLIGKDYDMPVAVLSSLTLGLAVDFAIHFLARSREMYQQTGSWQATAPRVFGEPARAIARNVIVIAAGFLPLLLAPLVPYKTVGAFLATILLVSVVATLLLLPALIRLLAKALFAPSGAMGVACHCGTCLIAAVTLAAVVVLNVYRYLDASFGVLAGISLAVVLAMAGGCALLGRREACKVQPQAQETSDEHPPSA